MVKVRKQWWSYRLKLFLSEVLRERKQMVFDAEENEKPELLWKDQTRRSSSKLCVFAHFDKEGEVSPYVIEYIKEIRERGGFDVIFCTTSPRWTDSAKERLSPYCYMGLRRSNQGLDFASWRCGLTYYGGQIDMNGEILFVNDSVYPTSDLASLFSRLNESTADLVGVCDSLESNHHLQSFFLLFRERALGSSFFKYFLENTETAISKRQIIWKYEIGFSQQLLNEGLKVESVYDLSMVMRNSPKLNPTMQRGLEICTMCLFPFLKRQVAVKYFGSDSKHWRELLEIIEDPFKLNLLDHIRFASKIGK